MINETCGCGASITLERSDEVKIWRKWKHKHSCPPAEIVITSATTETELASTVSTAEYPLGFQWIDDEPEE